MKHRISFFLLLVCAIVPLQAELLPPPPVSIVASWTGRYFLHCDYNLELFERSADEKAYRLVTQFHPKDRFAIKALIAEEEPLIVVFGHTYLAHDPAKLTWEDGFGPFLQVLPCNCGQEGSIDTNEFRRFFPAYSKASSAWEELDWKQKQTYDALRVSRPRDEEERKVDDAEMADLKARFLRLKEANQSSQPTRGKAPRG